MTEHEPKPAAARPPDHGVPPRTSSEGFGPCPRDACGAPVAAVALAHREVATGGGVAALGASETDG